MGTIFGISAVFSQSQNWWRTNGNTPQSTDFLGTSNNSPLIIKTNNVERLRIAPNGFIGIANSNPQYLLDVNGRTKFRFNVYCDSLMQCGALKVNNLSGSNNGLLITDAQGNLSRFNWSGNNNDVLTGNGNWTSINTLLPPQLWQNSGQNIFYTNGNVGIGTNSPLFSLDVVGDVRVSNNVYVGGGVVISDKVNAFTEVTAPKMTASEAKVAIVRADSIMMDSTKAIYGQTIVRGDVKLENKLTIQGDAKFSGNLVATQGIKFNDSIGFKYIPGNGNMPDYIVAGKVGPPPPPISPCTNPIPKSSPIFYGGGWLQLYSNNTSLELITDGANSLIESSGNGGLLLNYYCGKDVAVGSPNSGNLIANQKLIVNGDAYLGMNTGNVGIRTNNPQKPLDVIGAIRTFYTSAPNSNNILGSVEMGFDGAHAYLTGTDNTASDGKEFLINFSDPTTDIILASNNTIVNGKLGVGTNNPQFSLDINGNVRIGNKSQFTGPHIDAILNVFGKAVFTRAIVTQLNWADYVFKEEYKIYSLEELEEYIKKYHHLPNVPSDTEIINKGLDIGEIQKIQMEKIEEIIIYLIQLKKEIENIKTTLK